MGEAPSLAGAKTNIDQPPPVLDSEPLDSDTSAQFHTEQIDKSKYNDILKDYNTRAAQGNCKGQCHGFEAGFEEEKEFNSRMINVRENSHAGEGHALTYRETNWLWKFGGGDDIHVDGNVLNLLEVPGRTIVSPFPRLDDLKVHGSVAVNNGEIQNEDYDFNPQEVRWYDGVGHIRNFLNEEAIKQHGAGEEFQLIFDYGDKGTVE